MEIKREILEITDKLPNEVLGELLQCSRQIEKNSTNKIRISLLI